MMGRLVVPQVPLLKSYDWFIWVVYWIVYDRDPNESTDVARLTRISTRRSLYTVDAAVAALESR